MGSIAICSYSVENYQNKFNGKVCFIKYKNYQHFDTNNKLEFPESIEILEQNL